ncbi:hypothetical protein K2173_007148 [Erythroxylum novogranatense]|uniref:PH domain-containing protein n=1 Tax=Erythroxylum novogranatense TaxID=1862640 RepID=A0AAV8SYG4_9ROSI|nr:hypothetical protein K2173_007148 [Erythroxylum novogranatense]
MPCAFSWGQATFRELKKYFDELPIFSPLIKFSFCVQIRFCNFFLDHISFMEDGLNKIKIVPDHFQVSNSIEETPKSKTSSIPPPRISSSSRSRGCFWTGRKLRTAVMRNFFSIPGLPWAELESLRSELAELEEREAYLKVQLEHVDEILGYARLSGYLYIRTRWTALPGEPAPIDDTDVDDWLPRFLVLHGPCIFFYLSCTDLSPQDSTLLSDIVEVGSLPSFTREDDETRHCFYILTNHGLRYECSNNSKMQVDLWLEALKTNCKLGSDTKAPNGMTAS